MMKYLCFDISNMLYRTFFANKQEDDSTIAGLATHMAFITLNKYFRLHKPDKVVMAFDRKSWRKAYTASDLCISGRPYKGNRRKDMSPSQQAKYERFIGHLHEFENLVVKNTTIVTLACEMLEADDLIAGFVQNNPNDQITIISSDSDLLQLLVRDNVTIISPATDKPVTLKEYNNDPKYYLFHKCLRGDTTDNIQSAYPRLRATEIEKGYKDPFARVQIMQHMWKDVDGKERKVQSLFEENELLIDLTKQPENIRRKIDETIENELSKEKKFSHFHIMKYLGKYELNEIAAQLDNFIPLLSK